MKKYRVTDAALDQFPQLFTQLNGKRLTLHGKSELVEIDATARSPKKTITVPMATEAELAALYKEGNPFIEEYEVAEEKVADKAGK